MTDTRPKSKYLPRNFQEVTEEQLVAFLQGKPIVKTKVIAEPGTTTYISGIRWIAYALEGRFFIEPSLN